MNTKVPPVLGVSQVAVLLALLAPFPDSEARTQGKVVKPPRGAPAPQTRTLTMPPAYAAKVAASSRAHRGLAAGKLAASSAPWTVVRESTHQTPIFMESNRTQGAAAKPAAVASDVQVLQFITENAALFRLRDPSSELVHRATTRDRTGREHVQLEQRYQDVPVWGASIVGHWSAEQGLYALNGRYQPSPDYVTEVEPSVPRETAIDRALADLKLRRSIETFSPGIQELLNYRGPEAGLYLWSARLQEPVRLTWVVEIRPNLHERWRYFVDAHTGEVLESYQASPSDGPAVGRGVDLHGNTVDLHTYEAAGVFFLHDGPRDLETLDAHSTNVVVMRKITSTDNTFTDPVAVSAHDNMARIHEYFLENHGRRGIFPDGSSIISLIHVTEDEGRPMDNAYWNGRIMAYGDGGDVFSPVAGALDIAAHEMTHGIIELTVNLEYRFQSGALNESFADIFGAMVDDDDWLMGEDIVNKDYYPSGAMRNLRDPHNGEEPDGWGWQPAHMDEYMELALDYDNGGVHVNSGIPNRAAYLMAEAIGREKTAQIYYHILEARYLAPRSQFIDCRLAAERAAGDLFGDGSPEVAAVSSAYDAVGITVEEAPEPPPVDVAAGPGEQWVASVADELDGDNSLWLVKPTSDPLELRDGWEHIFQLTPTQVLAGSGRAIAAPVNGGFLLFIDSDNNLRYINTDGTGEEVIGAHGDWHSIALSPDGRRWVTTTTYDEPVIWYCDDSDCHQIQLYQPTTQDGIRQDIVRYADVLQWDATGTYVIYDAFNSLPGPAGETIDFWTVNALDPTSATIWPIFAAQPEGVHITSPSLSSAIRPDGTIDDCRLLYERVDQPNERTEIRVIDFCTGEEGVLLTLEKPFFLYPGFMNGDREIAFEWWVEEDGVTHLFRQPLTKDGFSSRGDPLSFVPYAHSALSLILSSAASDVASAGGTAVEEQAGTPQPAAFSLTQNYPNPFNAGTLISYSVPSASRVILDIFNIHGQRVAAVDQGLRAAGTHTASWAGLDAEGRPLASGVYFYRLRLSGEAREVEPQIRKMLLLR